MSDFAKSSLLPKFSLWRKYQKGNQLVSFDLEITARCNNNCRHCYINVPANDAAAKSKELSFGQIKDIVDQAAGLGALWCLITGGEPLLRKDFIDIYLYIKKKGLLVSVFTNAALMNDEHIRIFRKYPPRDIEVTVYGATQKTYEHVTRKRGSFDAFTRSLHKLLENRIPVRFKAMAMRSNVHELTEIADFCRARTKDYFRFDPFLHLRFDGNAERNRQIRSERLSPEEIVALENADSDRSAALVENCKVLINPDFTHTNCDHLFHCGVGMGNFTVSYDGFFRLCATLSHPDCVCDLRKVSVRDAFENFTLKVMDMRSTRSEFLSKCRKCSIINLCMWCPAYSYLETGELDTPIEYFCEVAKARAFALNSHKG